MVGGTCAVKNLETEVSVQYVFCLSFILNTPVLLLLPFMLVYFADCRVFPKSLV